MNAPIVQCQRGVTLVGGGRVGARLLRRALTLAPVLVAADGGADRALAAGLLPDAVIGDLDSLSPEGRAALPEGRLHRIDEQETTDFDKCLRSIEAPFVLGLGLAGPRLDHTLAALNVLARHPDRRCLILGAREVCFLCPPRLELALPPGTRLSLFPLAPVRGESAGLRWPVGGIDFAPGGRIGTSNVTEAPRVRLAFDAPAMLVLLPAGALRAALEGLVPGPGGRPGG
jgi:thiamine pyrophosphokinase